MSPETFWAARGGLGALLLGFWFLGWVLFGHEDGAGRRWYTSYVGQLDRRLRFLRSTTTGTQVVLAQGALGLALLVGAVLSGIWPLFLLCSVVALFPQVNLKGREAARITKFDEQIEGWLSAMSNSLKASPSLPEAIASTINLVPAPMSEEVDILVKEYHFGTPLDRALDNMAERIDSSTLAGTVLALKVARKSGGNLPQMLDTTASALRELARLEGVVRTKTAEGRAQAVVIGGIPIPMMGLLQWMDPTFFDPLFNNLRGYLVLGAAGFLWILAIFAAQKILDVDV